MARERALNQPNTERSCVDKRDSTKKYRHNDPDQIPHQLLQYSQTSKGPTHRINRGPMCFHVEHACFLDWKPAKIETVATGIMGLEREEVISLKPVPR